MKENKIKILKEIIKEIEYNLENKKYSQLRTSIKNLHNFAKENCDFEIADPIRKLYVEIYEDDFNMFFIEKMFYKIKDLINKIDSSDEIPTENKIDKIPNILIGEDNIINQEFLKTILHNFNLNFKIAKDGNEFIKNLTENNYDILILDEKLPDITGIELYHKIQQKQKYIIGVLIKSNSELKSEFEKLNLHFIFEKPITKNNINKIIEIFNQNNIK